MTAPFERLPAEIFDSIAACLDLPEFQTLRLASQSLHCLTLSTFTKKYFSKLITTLGSPSLDRVVHVASHGHLSCNVTTLEIRLLTHRNYKDLTKIARIGRLPPPKRFDQVSCVRNQDIVLESKLYDDVLSNRQARCITERLARGLSGLENLTTIRFRAHEKEPHGWKTTPVPEGDDVFRSRCLRAVLDAVIKSDISLDAFVMGKQKGAVSLSKCANVPYPALQFPLEYLQRLTSPFTTLTCLTLSVVAEHNGHHRLPGWENGISRFISSAPNLAHLTLSLDRKAQVSQYGARIMRSLSDSISLDSLESLHVCNTTVHESDLAKIVMTHAATLQHINLTNVCLLTGNWFVLLTALKTVEQLQTLRLAGIEGVGCPVQFRHRNKERRKATLDTAKRGQAMAELLDELIGACSMEVLPVMYSMNSV